MMSTASDPTSRSRPRTLALELVDSLGDRIRDGRLAPGDKLPTEAEIMAQFGVSRTVVREALSKLQASGLVQTRHGIGTFVIGFADGATFRIAPEQVATVLERGAPRGRHAAPRRRRPGARHRLGRRLRPRAGELRLRGRRRGDRSW